MTTTAPPAADAALPEIETKAKAATLLDLEIALDGVNRACAVMSVVEDAVLTVVSEENKKKFAASWWKDYVLYILTEEQDNAIHEAILHTLRSVDTTCGTTGVPAA